MKNLLKEIEGLINKYSLDNESNTPDYVFASFLMKIITAYLEAMDERDMHKQGEKSNDNSRI